LNSQLYIIAHREYLVNIDIDRWQEFCHSLNVLELVVCYTVGGLQTLTGNDNVIRGVTGDSASSNRAKAEVEELVESMHAAMSSHRS
jgi:hypothetical protein